MFCRRVRVRVLIVLCAATLSSQPVCAQPGPSNPKILLVFPFENLAAAPRLEWLGEGLEELTIQALSSARQQVYSHDGRRAEMERNGLPLSAKISRASMLRIAQDLDADFVIFGSFTSDGKTLTVESRLLRTDPLALLPAVRETGPLDSMIELQSKIVWRLLSASDREYRSTLAEFSKAQRALRLDAFEHYIRGLNAPDDQARLRELREASRLEPSWPDPYFALGETYFSRNDCATALPFFSHVPVGHARYIEALFSSAVCRLQMNQADRAEETFLNLQKSLGANGSDDAQGGASGADVPEILNNLAIARARQGKAAAAQTDLRRAMELDPDEDDYPFNLGLLAMQSGDYAGAASDFHEAAERRPENAEDRAFLVQALEKSGKTAEADEEREFAKEALGPNALSSERLEPRTDLMSRLARVRTELDTAALRLEVASATTAARSDASAAGTDSTAARVRRGRQELAAGQIDAADADFRGVLKVEPANAAAHRGLAEIFHRRGKFDDAVGELQSSLQARDSAVVRTILARVYLEQKKPDLARAEAQRALKLAPNYSEAKQLLERLQTSKPKGGAQ
jgi:tetratricopeptide (TPR) repeat protein/TolB-like protein